jgi:hypothetical protein
MYVQSGINPYRISIAFLLKSKTGYSCKLRKSLKINKSSDGLAIISVPIIFYQEFWIIPLKKSP